MPSRHVGHRASRACPDLVRGLLHPARLRDSVLDNGAAATRATIAPTASTSRAFVERRALVDGEQQVSVLT